MAGERGSDAKGKKAGSRWLRVEIRIDRCPGCGFREFFAMSLLSVARCRKLKVLPICCSYCGRHIQVEDRCEWRAGGPG